ncbi:MAG: site-specific integrase [Flavobacteriales bacterium]|nr:site-specific integrase [Flavobacteriales bacterium]
MLKKIEVKTLVYKNEQRLALYFPYNEELVKLIKSFPDAAWSNSNKCWHIANGRNNMKELFQVFKGKAYLDTSTIFSNKEEQKKQIIPVSEKIRLETTLTSQQIEKISQFKDWLNSRRYSPNTVKTYTESLKTFLRFYNNKPLNEINNQDLIKFNNEYILKNGYSSSFQNQVVNAIKLFFKKIENTQLEIDLIHRPKREKKLPNVLSKEEIKQILEAPTNLKHKAMLSLIYACGLRAGELIRLKPNDVDSKRGLLIVRQSKGKKDRITPLSEKIIVLLREYYKTHKPGVYLFEGQNKDHAYDLRSLQLVLKRALQKAKINKPATLHWLRHSYATHLLENGTDLRYIQEILGHSSSKTTEIYTYVSTKSIQKITSPFDYL